MSILKWTARIVKGSGAGTGWITLPHKLHNKVVLEKFYEVNFTSNEGIQFSHIIKLSKLKNIWGFYIPKAICATHNLIGQRVAITLKPTEYFPAKISADKQVRILISIVECLNIKENEIYEVELNIQDKIFHEVILISKTNRSNRADEFYFTIRMQKIPTEKELKFKFNKKLEILTPNMDNSSEDIIYIQNLFHDGILGKLSSERMIIFLGNHLPIITPIKIKISNLIHYFGCYYADGTKSGWGWSISASTPEQAIYYVEKYKSIVLNSDINFQLTYTQRPSIKKNTQLIKKNLMRTWYQKTGIRISQDKIYILPSAINNPEDEIKFPGHNPIGSLRIIDNRGLIMKLYLKILKEIEKFLINTNNDYLIWLFLFGIMEGDGSVGGGRARCRIHITTFYSNKLILLLLKKVGIHQIVKEYIKEKNTLELSFGLIPILKNLQMIQKYLFKYYSKRRRTFIKRFLKLPSIQYLIGEKENLSNFALSPLVKNNLINDKNLIFKIKELKTELLH